MHQKMRKVEVLETIVINGKVYPKKQKITFIDEPKPNLGLEKTIRNQYIAEKIFSDEYYTTLRLSKEG